MSRRKGEFEHRTSIFEGAYRAWSHLGGLEPDDVENKAIKDMDPLTHPIENDPRLKDTKLNKEIKKENNSDTESSIKSYDEFNTKGRVVYPYEPLPRSGLGHPYIQAILSPWLGPDVDLDSKLQGLTTLRTWWQHRRGGESKSAIDALSNDHMKGIVEGYTRHFFTLAHCLVINDDEQAPRTLDMKLKKLGKLKAKKKKKRPGDDSKTPETLAKIAKLSAKTSVRTPGDTPAPAPPDSAGMEDTSGAAVMSVNPAMLDATAMSMNPMVSAGINAAAAAAGLLNGQALTPLERLYIAQQNQSNGLAGIQSTNANPANMGLNPGYLGFGGNGMVSTPRIANTQLSMTAKPVDGVDDGTSNEEDDQDVPAVGGFSLSNRIVHTLDPCIVKTKEWMGRYAHLWGADPLGIVSLAQGVVYWKPPPSCHRALVDAVTKGGIYPDENNEESDPLALHSYSPAQGLPELIGALESKIAIEHKMVNHDVMVTVGANQAYTNVVLTLLGGSSGTDNMAIVFAPYYFNHVMAIQMCAGPEAVLVGPTDMSTGIPDVEWLERTLSAHQNPDDERSNGIRMVTLVNPGNPTGIALSRETIKSIVDLCRDHGVWVVLDCTYEHFFNTGDKRNNGEKDAKNPLPTFPGEPHVVHIFSFSKSYAMAGYRCGYVVSRKRDATGREGEFLSQMLKVQDTIPIGPPRLSQHVALGALREGAATGSQPNLYSPSSKEWVYKKYATLCESRNYILTALSALPQQIGGSGSMYVMGKLPENLDIPRDNDDIVHGDEPIDVLFCRRLVRDYGIAIIPGSFCGTPGWIRVCYANLSPERTKIAAVRLRKGIGDLMLTRAVKAKSGEN